MKRIGRTAHLLGLLSIGLWPLAPIALVLGIAGLVREKHGAERMSAFIGAFAGLVMTIVLAIFMIAVVPVATSVTRDSACQDSVRELGHQVLQWSAQHGGCLPDADSWLDDLKGAGFEVNASCPADRRRGVVSSYAFNVALSGKFVHELKDTDLLILLFDANVAGHNLHAALGSIAYRHTGAGREPRAGVVCVSGRAPLLSPEDIFRHQQAERDQSQMPSR